MSRAADQREAAKGASGERSDPRAVTGGTYTLVVWLPERAAVAFGAAGERDLRPAGTPTPGARWGWVGSRASSATANSHWHVDHRLEHPESTVETVVRSAGVGVECAVAGSVTARLDPVPGLGASDCRCDTHLAGDADCERVVAAVERSHERARG